MKYSDEYQKGYLESKIKNNLANGHRLLSSEIVKDMGTKGMRRIVAVCQSTTGEKYRVSISAHRNGCTR